MSFERLLYDGHDDADEEEEDDNFRLLMMTLMTLMMMLVMTFTQIFFSWASSPCSAEPVAVESCLRSKPRPEC